MELIDYLKVIRRYWFVTTACVLLGLAVAGVITIQQPQVYAANASGFVSTGTTQGAAEASISDSLAKSRATSYVDLAKSRAIATDVATSLGLNTSPAALIGRISVQQPADTVLLRITARAPTATEAQELADAWVASLAEQVAEIESPGGPSQIDGQTLKLLPIESAELPSSPVSPDVRRNLAFGFVAGLLLGAGVAVLRSQLDRRIGSADEVEAMFGVTVAAAIPTSDALKRDAGGLDGHVMVGKTGTVGTRLAREAFLKLRTNLQYMDVDSPPRVLVVTSPLPGDGKSTVAANLAAAISATGQQVVLIDGDLRRPVVAQSFKLSDGVGLTDLIIGRATARDVLQPVSGLPNLSVIAAGQVPPNPSELLGSKAMGSVLQALSSTHIVVIDAPPLLPVTDAAVLTTHADGALVVISFGKTLDTQLGTALSHIAHVNGHALGVVLNRVKKRDTGTGYYGDYYGESESSGRSKKSRSRKRASTKRKSSGDGGAGGGGRVRDTSHRR